LNRREAEQRGRRSERIAALWLRLKGYRILAVRVRTPIGEVDLVARRGCSLVFVEVKSRDDPDDAGAAIAPHQLRRVARAANLLLGRYMADCRSARIDAVIVARGRLPIHLEAVVDGDWR
jgi:putative endonuclease